MDPVPRRGWKRTRARTGARAYKISRIPLDESIGTLGQELALYSEMGDYLVVRR